MGHQQAGIFQTANVDETISICPHDRNNSPLAGWSTAGPDKNYQHERRTHAGRGGFSPLLQVDGLTARRMDNRCRRTKTLEALHYKDSNWRERADRKFLLIRKPQPSRSTTWMMSLATWCVMRR